jgi:hypothetical protein
MGPELFALGGGAVMALLSDLYPDHKIVLLIACAVLTALGLVIAFANARNQPTKSEPPAALQVGRAGRVRLSGNRSRGAPLFSSKKVDDLTAEANDLDR